MNLISFVFQDTFLFYDTLYENIAVGSPNATREQVEAATTAPNVMSSFQICLTDTTPALATKEYFYRAVRRKESAMARAILKMHPFSYSMKLRLLPTPKMNTRCNKPCNTSSKTKPSSS